MKEQDVHKLIEQQDPEHKQELLEKIKLRIATEVVPEQAESAPAPASRRKNRLTVIFASVLTACLLCLAIVLPVTLSKPSNRYCAAGDYAEEVLTYNIKEYANRTNKALLYINMYDTADEVVTALNYNVKNHDDMIYLNEMLINGQTGEIITLYVTDNRTTVDVLNVWNICKTEININGVKVKINFSQSSLAKFEYNGYCYYIQIDNVTDSSRITQIVELMFSVQQI